MYKNCVDLSLKWFPIILAHQLPLANMNATVCSPKQDVFIYPVAVHIFGKKVIMWTSAQESSRVYEQPSFPPS